MTKTKLIGGVFTLIGWFMLIRMIALYSSGQPVFLSSLFLATPFFLTADIIALIRLGQLKHNGWLVGMIVATLFFYPALPIMLLAYTVASPNTSVDSEKGQIVNAQYPPTFVQFVSCRYCCAIRPSNETFCANCGRPLIVVP